MKAINSKDALNKILQAGPEFLIDADSLNYLIKDEEPVACYEDSNSIIFISKYDDTDDVTVVPMNYTFDVDTFIKLLNENCTNPSILINIQKLSPEYVDKLDCALNETFEHKRTLEDYMYYSDNSDTATTSNIRFLDVSDKDLFTALPAEPVKNRPPLHVLFDIFVVKKQGYILGAFDEDRLVGYLAFNKILPNVFDVDYIYVDPDQRGKGIGKELGKFYAAYACENKHIAYWSNAKNDASKNTAMSCGFQLIRQAKKYTKKL